MKFWRCFWYLIIISILAFFLGRILPKSWFCADRFPYRACKFEKNGKIYDKLNIRKWQNKVPDMSRIVPFMMPKKKLTADFYNKLPRMIEETCVAEFIHGINCIAGFYCIVIYPQKVGFILAVIYAVVFNLPYMLIQRYNRPRLIALYERLKKRKESNAGQYTKGESNANVNFDIKLQYGGGAQLLRESN